MDAETVEAIDALRQDIHGVRGEVQELRGEMQVMRTDLMQHTRLLYERLHDDIRIVAEGFAVLSAKVDALASGRQSL